MRSTFAASGVSSPVLDEGAAGPVRMRTASCERNSATTSTWPRIADLDQRAADGHHVLALLRHAQHAAPPRARGSRCCRQRCARRAAARCARGPAPPAAASRAACAESQPRLAFVHGGGGHQFLLGHRARCVRVRAREAERRVGGAQLMRQPHPRRRVPKDRCAYRGIRRAARVMRATTAPVATASPGSTSTRSTRPEIGRRDHVDVVHARAAFIHQFHAHGRRGRWGEVRLHRSRQQAPGDEPGQLPGWRYPDQAHAPERASNSSLAISLSI